MNDLASPMTGYPIPAQQPHLPDPIRDALTKEAERREAARNAEAVRDQLASDVEGLGEVADGLRTEMHALESQLRDLGERLQQTNDRRAQQQAARIGKQAEYEQHLAAAAMYRRMAEREAADLHLPLPAPDGTGPQQVPPGPRTADQVRQHAGLAPQEHRPPLAEGDVETTRADMQASVAPNGGDQPSQGEFQGGETDA